MDSTRQSTPEAGAYRMLHDVVAELEQAASALAIVQGATPDTERQHHLEAIRTAIATLRTVVPPAPTRPGGRDPGSRGDGARAEAPG